MDKVLSIVITAAVVFSIVIIGLSMIQGSFSFFGDSATNIEQKGCNYQIREVGPKGKASTVNQKCREKYKEEVSQYKAMKEYGLLVN